LILIGYNGAGKTTLIHQLLGFLPKNNKNYSLKALNQLGLKPLNNSKNNIGFAQEIPNFVSSLSAIDYFKLVSKFNKSNFDEFFNLAKKLNLENFLDLELNKYSKGMKQRLSIILALIGKPKFLIFDEPTSGLDIFGDNLVISILKEIDIKEQNLIISTHSIDLAFELSFQNKTQVSIMHNYIIARQFLPKTREELKKELLKYPPKRLK
jgi:ABC-2 type transport system ATP-binding protein